MNKLWFLLLTIPLMGMSCNPPQPGDACADRPVYKEYRIDMPARPKMTANNEFNSDGEFVRAVEFDMSLLAEYAEKLENLLKSLPSNLAIPK